MRYRIVHETILDYPLPIREHHAELRLTPRADQHQLVHASRIETDPAVELKSYVDYFGNRVDYFCVIAPHSRLVTRLVADVEPLRDNPFDFVESPPAEQAEWYRREARANSTLNDYVLHRSAMIQPAAKLAAEMDRSLPVHAHDSLVMPSLMALMEWLPTVLEYRPGATKVHANLLEAVRQGGGVCQDFAHLFIAVARSWGIPARYVMGYQDPGLTAQGGPSEAATHAWAEALVPGGGWIGFDATHNLLANDRYIPVAVGRDSCDAAPQRGSFKGDDPGSKPVVNISISNQ